MGPDGDRPKESSWDNPNYTDRTSRSSAIIGTNIFLTLFATIIVLLRLFTRHKIVRSVGADDWLILLGLVLAWFLAGWNCIGTGIGLGRHKWDIQQQDYTGVGKVVWGTMTLYVPVVGIIKLSILFSLRRITPSAFNRQCIYAMMGVVGALTFSLTFATLFQCTPLKKIYEFVPSRAEFDPVTGMQLLGNGIPGRCVNREVLLYAGGALNVFVDLVILGIPIPMLMGLGLPTKQKALLIGVFSLGGVACIASMARLAMITEVLRSPDPTWVLHKLSITSCVEISLGIVCASIPTLKPFLSRYIPSILGNTENRYSTNGPPGSRSSHQYQRPTGGHGHGAANKFGSITIPSRAGSWYTEQQAADAEEARDRLTNPHKYRKLSNTNEDDDDEANVGGERPEMAYVRAGATTNVPKITYTSLVKKKPAPLTRKMTVGSNTSSRGYGRLNDDDDDGGGEMITIMHPGDSITQIPPIPQNPNFNLTQPPTTTTTTTTFLVSQHPGGLNQDYYQESPIIPPHQISSSASTPQQQHHHPIHLPQRPAQSSRAFPMLQPLSTPSPTSAIIFTARSGPLSPVPSAFHPTPPTSALRGSSYAAPITSALSTLSMWGKERLWNKTINITPIISRRTEEPEEEDVDPHVPRFNLTRGDSTAAGGKLVMVPAWTPKKGTYTRRPSTSTVGSQRSWASSVARDSPTHVPGGMQRPPKGSLFTPSSLGGEPASVTQPPGDYAESVATTKSSVLTGKGGRSRSGKKRVAGYERGERLVGGGGDDDGDGDGVYVGNGQGQGQEEDEEEGYGSYMESDHEDGYPGHSSGPYYGYQPAQPARQQPPQVVSTTSFYPPPPQPLQQTQRYMYTNPNLQGGSAAGYYQQNIPLPQQQQFQQQRQQFDHNPYTLNNPNINNNPPAYNYEPHYHHLQPPAQPKNGITLPENRIVMPKKIAAPALNVGIQTSTSNLGAGSVPGGNRSRSTSNVAPQGGIYGIQGTSTTTSNPPRVQPPVAGEVAGLSNVDLTTPIEMTGRVDGPPGFSDYYY